MQSNITRCWICIDNRIFPFPFSAWDDAALVAQFNNREWYWIDDHSCCVKD